jgi:hypothetical protein
MYSNAAFCPLKQRNSHWHEGENLGGLPLDAFAHDKRGNLQSISDSSLSANVC